jgi:tyrosinase
VWKLEAWDPSLVWYAKAVAEMQRRPIATPTSWRYQAAVHDYTRQDDPNASPGDVLPSDQTRFWRQCQHNSWFFLPWHRMYLACFEQIVAATVVALGGPEAWALPYWNYSDPTNPNARKLPPAFVATSLPTGEPNPLRVDARAPGANTGADLAEDTDVDLVGCLSDASYVAQSHGGDPGFGGPQTKFNHDTGTVVGRLELVPHGSMHVAVGGRTGWMSTFDTAALDPIFWLHHSNIDRLWEVWLRRDASNTNPTVKSWFTSTKFEFHDATGQTVAFTPSQIVDPSAPLLGYQYEDVSDPLSVPQGPPKTVRRAPMARARTPEMVGATDHPVTLDAARTTARMTMTTPAGPAAPAARRRLKAGPARRAYLNLENVSGTGGPTRYSVYLNLPADANPADHRDRYAGLLPMFGVKEATRADAQHPGGGLNYALEVTDLVDRLRSLPDWSDAELHVTFVARGGEPAPSAVQVGRVSLYYA